MKLTISTEGKEILELTDATVCRYRVVHNKTIDFGIVQKEPCGELITIVVNNMPMNLLEEIDGVIRQYCNH